MALTIESNLPEYPGKTHVVTWHVGQETQKIRNISPYVFNCWVDGDELEFIINNFTNIVIPKHQRVVRFFGDTAKMIVGNL